MGESISGRSERDAAHLARLAVHRLITDLGRPHTLAEVKIPPEGIPALAQESFGNQRLLKNNPRSACAKDLTRILEAASGAVCG